MSKQGILLLNIGSPSSFEKEDVARYLKKFLMDERVIDIPFIFRWMLVHLLIVPRRSAASAGNYKKVWLGPEGSPLIAYSQRFAQSLQSFLGKSFSVKIAMRYSSPSIEEAILDLEEEGVDSYIVIPMFPQYAEATTGSAIAATKNVLKRLGIKKSVEYIESFYNLSAFIDSAADIGQKENPNIKNDFVLFSFHGLPERQVLKNPDCKIDDKCCENKNYNCYLAQCLKTAELLASALDLKRDQWQVTFQSRLGREKWLEPSTEKTLSELPKKGFKNVTVFSPSFVADCIETIEELGMGGKEIFLENGGENFHLITCVNDAPPWVSGFANFIQEKASAETQ